MSRIVSPFLISRTMARPLNRAARTLAESTAGIVLDPGRERPKTSARICIVFAVPMIGHAPAVGQAFSSSPVTSCSVTRPASNAPNTASLTSAVVMRLPPHWPLSMGPPDTYTVGSPNRSAPMMWPGMMLSVEDKRTKPLK